jgi:hypothetical protein
MKPSFFLRNFAFFEIESHAGESLIRHLSQTYGADKIPKSVWQKDLSTLPSPIRASDCIGVWASGLIPTCTASIGDTTLDIIRKERNPTKNEPPFNCYFHYIIKNSDGSLYISEPLIPEHHWAVAEDLINKYGDRFSEEIKTKIKDI